MRGVFPTRHVARIGSIEMAGTREPAQHPSAALLLHCGEIFWPQRAGLGGLDLPVCTLGEHPVDHAAVKMDSGQADSQEMGVSSIHNRLTLAHHQCRRPPATIGGIRGGEG